MCDCSVVLEELARVKREGTPGVMHAVDQAFYDLTVNQRDRAWRRIEDLERELADTRAKLSVAEKYVPRDTE